MIRKTEPTSIRENGYLLPVPTPGTDQRWAYNPHSNAFSLFSHGICGLLSPSPNLRPRALSRCYKAGRLEKCDCGDARICFCYFSLTVLLNVLQVGWLLHLFSLLLTYLLSFCTHGADTWISPMLPQRKVKTTVSCTPRTRRANSNSSAWWSPGRPGHCSCFRE